MRCSPSVTCRLSNNGWQPRSELSKVPSRCSQSGSSRLSRSHPPFLLRWSRLEFSAGDTAQTDLLRRLTACATRSTARLTRPPPTGKIRLAEFELVGRQSRIQELIGALDVQDEKLVVVDLNELVLELLDAMTGGGFRVADRPLDLDRAARVQAAAARLNGALRVALSRRVRGWEWRAALSRLGRLLPKRSGP